MRVFRAQIDRPAGLLKRLLGRVGAEQRLGTDGVGHRVVGPGGHELIAKGQGANVVLRAPKAANAWSIRLRISASSMTGRREVDRNNREF